GIAAANLAHVQLLRGELEDAADLIWEAMQRLAAERALRFLCNTLDTLALIHVGRGAGELAAAALGTRGAILGAIGYATPRESAGEVAETYAQARAVVGPGFDEAVAAARVDDLEETLENALLLTRQARARSSPPNGL